ncbi:hypothetical protein [Clostridium sp.]|uniref:hypothetical protein n=1 Tax=Clostridium sp. TaxID=1506 RepID=UPI00290EBC0D|nr:hypothetical protein [Clostridium sp.]MDU4847514.1 hypothetical protein [Clostridium sp.]
MQLTLAKMIDSFNTNEKKNIINYIAGYKRKSEKISYDEYIKWALVFAPIHKWYIEAFNYEKEIQKVYKIITEDKETVKRYKSFDEILMYMDTINVDGFGELAKYDTALAVGISLNLMPDKVFIHAGPRHVLKYILQNKYGRLVKRLNNSKQMEYIDIENLPNEFNQFKHNVYLIEDCLCYIYSNYLK